jgi:L-threonylcarbamoyladenylate synthase
MPALPDAEAPRASGTLESHYAPHTPVVLINGADLDRSLHALHEHDRRVALIHYRPVDAPVAARLTLSMDATAYAHDLYAALRRMDEAHADVIVVEAPPMASAWSGVNDRLRRAAHDSAGILDRLLQG